MIELYTRTDCSYCVRAKNLLQSLGLEYKTYLIGEQVSRDDVLAKFPNAMSLPIVVVNGVYIGGYEQMEQAIMENKETFGKTQING